MRFQFRWAIPSITSKIILILSAKSKFITSTIQSSAASKENLLRSIFFLALLALGLSEEEMDRNVEINTANACSWKSKIYNSCEVAKSVPEKSTRGNSIGISSIGWDRAIAASSTSASGKKRDSFELVLWIRWDIVETWEIYFCDDPRLNVEVKPDLNSANNIFF